MKEKNVDGSASESKEVEVYTWTPNKCMDLGILLELGSMGAGNAATSLSQILQQPISIEVPKIHTFPAHLIPKFYEMHERPTTALFVQLNEESECDILLLFDREDAKKIAAIMTMSASADEVTPEMEASAIEELANILIGSFLSAISDFTGIRLMATPPQRVVDSFDAIIDNFLVKQALVSDEVIIFDTRFKREEEKASCILMVFPSKELQEILISKAKQWIEDDSNKCEAEAKQEIIVDDSSVNIVNAAKEKGNGVKR
ncbi:MAG: chemotaxis protein CheC [Candidatus Bathyarchaeia archaeon]